MTPVNRLSAYYAEAAAASTADYVAYCVRRAFPNKVPALHYNRTAENGHLLFGLVVEDDGHTIVVRFRVPVDAGGAEIKLLVRDAANALGDLIVGIAGPTK